MMLSTLTSVALQLGLTFLYGEKQAFNIEVDNAQPPDATRPLIILYHEGYVSGSSAEDQQGAWEPTYQMRLWLLTPNTGENDKPIDRLPRFEGLEPIMYQVIRGIQNSGYNITGPIGFSEGINWTDKSLDGYRFQVNAKSRFPVTPECV